MGSEVQRDGDARKIVYDLHVELSRNPEKIRHAQMLTLNGKKPFLGLRGSHGLFGSEEWWENIRLNNITTESLFGTIIEVYSAGMNADGTPNTMVLQLHDGGTVELPIMVHDLRDLELFRLGNKVNFLYALDELKVPSGPGGDGRYSRITLEIAVSQSVNSCS